MLSSARNHKHFPYWGLESSSDITNSIRNTFFIIIINNKFANRIINIMIIGIAELCRPR
nr:MAG TPA: hypothetical protein [Crassvirales sp.]